MKIKRAKKLVEVAELYGETLTQTRLAIYLEILSDLSDEEFMFSFGEILKDPSIVRLPLPAKFLIIARPKLDFKDEAIEQLEKIKIAIKKFGWVDPTGAMNFLGPDLWDFIRRRGGWEDICTKEENFIMDPIVYAQMRDALGAQNKNSKIEKSRNFILELENKMGKPLLKN